MKTNPNTQWHRIPVMPEMPDDFPDTTSGIRNQDEHFKSGICWAAWIAFFAGMIVLGCIWSVNR